MNFCEFCMYPIFRCKLRFLHTFHYSFCVCARCMRFNISCRSKRYHFHEIQSSQSQFNRSAFFCHFNLISAEILFISIFVVNTKNTRDLLTLWNELNYLTLEPLCLYSEIRILFLAKTKKEAVKAEPSHMINFVRH